MPQQLKPAAAAARTHATVLALGFRLFYLLAGAYAAISIAVWSAQFSGWLPSPPLVQGPLWHAHEMLFGYTFAVITGFSVHGSEELGAAPDADRHAARRTRRVVGCRTRAVVHAMARVVGAHGRGVRARRCDRHCAAIGREREQAQLLLHRARARDRRSEPRVPGGHFRLERSTRRSARYGLLPTRCCSSSPSSPDAWSRCSPTMPCKAPARAACKASSTRRWGA